MTVAVIVDSAAALPPEVVRAYGIGVVPMTIVVDGELHHDTELPAAELLSLQQAGADITTSGPSPGEVLQQIERALERADAVLVLTLATQMSSTFTNATMAAGMTSGAVRVLDTRSAAGGEGLVAHAAARRAAEGADLDEVAQVAERVIDEVRFVATVDRLDHLVRSGRVPSLAGSAAGTLHVNPLFEFHQGEVRSLRPAIGSAAAEHRMVQRCLGTRPTDAPGATLHLAALGGLDPERGQRLLDAVLEHEPDADGFVASFGSVMLVHIGPGVAGLAWWWER